jgi:hypothetical protein
MNQFGEPQDFGMHQSSPILIRNCAAYLSLEETPALTPALSPRRGGIVRPRVANMNALRGRTASEAKSKVAPTATEMGKL